MRIKICRKEAKDSEYWLKLVDTGRDPEMERERQELIKEATELTSIFGAILQKSEYGIEHSVFEFWDYFGF
jgi:hypothetical protein